MTTRALLPALVSVTALLGGCANAFLKGGKMATADHATGARAAYRISTCTKLADNSTVAPPALTYHVFDLQGKPTLFERDTNGKGVIITNHWSDDKGDHYYVGVTSNGWEYVIPQSGPGARVIYGSVAVTQNPDGSTRPVSAPTARCELVAAN